MRRTRIGVFITAVALVVTMASPAAAVPPDHAKNQAFHFRVKASPQGIYDLGGIFQNACVQEGLDNEYRAVVDLLIKPPNNDVRLKFSAWNLIPGDNFDVYVDPNGKPPFNGRQTFLGSFTAAADGTGKFEMTWPAGLLLPGGDGAGNYTWDVYADNQKNCGDFFGSWSVFNLEHDIEFSIS